MPAKRASRKTKSRRVFGHGRKTQIRAGLYARVSTHDQQTLRLQNRAMQDYAARRGWTVTIEIKEVGSGASVRELRQKLLEAARRRDIDVVVVWRLDRWGRSMADLVNTLQELRDLDVGFVSLTEALDLTTPSGRAMAGLLAVFAEFEREILRERVRAGSRSRKRNPSRPPSNRGSARQANPETLRRRRQQGGYRPSAPDRPDLRPPHSGPEKIARRRPTQAYRKDTEQRRIEGRAEAKREGPCNRRIERFPET